MTKRRGEKSDGLIVPWQLDHHSAELWKPSKSRKGRRWFKNGMKAEDPKTPTEWEGKWERVLPLRTRQGKKGQKAVYNTVQCCSAPLSGMEGRAGTKGFCPPKEGQQLQRSPPFQPIWLWRSQDAPLTATACSASGHVRSLLSDRCSIRREVALDLHGNTRGLQQSRD